MTTDHDARTTSPYFKAVAIDFDGTLAEVGTAMVRPEMRA